MNKVIVLAGAALIASAVGVAVAQTTSPFNGVLLDAGTITTGGTAQKVFGGDYIENGYELVNPNTNNSDVCWYAQGAPAAVHGVGSAPIAPGAGYTSPRDYRTHGAYVSIICPTTGDTYIAKRW